MLGFGGFWCRYSVRFWKVRVQMLCEVPQDSDVFNGIGIYVFFGGQKHLNAIHDALVYL